jgi:integrase
MAQPQFKEGNQAARSARGKIGPRIVRLKHKPGYYIRWYEMRQAAQLIHVAATPDHGLQLQPCVKGGLVVMAQPKRATPFARVLQQSDIILAAAGQSVNSPEDFMAILAAHTGKTIGFQINRGGKYGTTPRFMKAGDTRDLAKEFLSRWQDVRRARDLGLTAKALTFAQLAQDYLQWAETLGGYSPSWLHEVKRIAAKHVERWGVWRLDQMHPSVFSDWAERRYAETSPYTVHKELHTLRGIFKVAIKNHHIAASPVQQIQVRKPPASTPKYLAQDEIATLIACAEQVDKHRLESVMSGKGTHRFRRSGKNIDLLLRFYNRDGTFDAARIRFLLLSALRKSQFIDLRWQQYDSKRGTITLQTTHEHSEKSRRVSVLPLPDEAIKIIEGQPRLGDYVFPNTDGGHDLQIQKRFERIACLFKAKTSKHVHLHMLRHTALTYLLQYTRDIALVSKFAGHSKIETTQIYAHVLEERMRQATKGFDITQRSA